MFTQNYCLLELYLYIYIRLVVHILYYITTIYKTNIKQTNVKLHVHPELSRSHHPVGQSHLGLRNLFAKEQNLGQQVLRLVVVMVLGRSLRLKELVEIEPGTGGAGKLAKTREFPRLAPIDCNVYDTL